MTSIQPSELLLSVSMAVAAGLVGSFAVMRRMTLAADAISHVALPGIGLAVVFRFEPLLGAVMTLLGGAFLIWGIERRTRLATETVTGVVFATALAVGSMLASGEELIDALFGAPGRMSPMEAVLGVLAALWVSAFILWRRNQLVLALVSPEIAHTSGVRLARLDLEYLLTFAITVALGLRYLGALLMGSLIIIPAAAARRLVRDLRSMLIASVLIAVGTTVCGLILAPILQQKTGPVIVTCAAAVFFSSLLFSRRT
jgi:ABC-type Mn2+/Zn2+ transport system permease subunit